MVNGPITGRVPITDRKGWITDRNASWGHFWCENIFSGAFKWNVLKKRYDDF